MKVILVYSVLFFIFINSTTGLKCYECDDYTSGFECNITTSFTNCHKKYDLCATYYYKNDKRLYYSCGQTDLCIQKRCAIHTIDYCRGAGTFEVIDHVHKKEFTVVCCKGDLCNRPSSAQYLNHNVFTFLFVFLFS